MAQAGSSFAFAVNDAFLVLFVRGESESLELESTDCARAASRSAHLQDKDLGIIGIY